MFDLKYVTIINYIHQSVIFIIAAEYYSRLDTRSFFTATELIGMTFNFQLSGPPDPRFKFATIHKYLSKIGTTIHTKFYPRSSINYSI